MGAARFGEEHQRQMGSAWTQDLFLFAAIFVVLMLLHAPLLRLPYFWDEAGYYIPAARDLYLTSALIPHSTPSNAHPPLVMAWLAAAWRAAGYSSLVTRTAILLVAAFALLGVFRLSRFAANLPVAWATTALVALYPVFFTQSSLAHLDLAAAGFTFWGLLAYLEDRPWKMALWFSLGALAKETAILAPLALFGWELVGDWLPRRWHELRPPSLRRTRSFPLLLPALPLACWYGYHFAKTGFLFGNPEFLRYNLTATIDRFRIPLAFGLRLWQAFGYFGLYLLTVAGLLAMRRRPLMMNGGARPRIQIWMQLAFLAVLVAYLAFMSVVGGAVLARYMLPVVPLVVLVMVSTLWRRVRYWRLVIVLVAIAFVAALFTNPPYGFSMEDNFAYRDYVMMHAEAGRFLALRYPRARVLTAWPASDELSRPWLGYVSRAFPVVRIEDFTAGQIAIAANTSSQFDVALAFSTKYQPSRPLLENWALWQLLKEKYFGYHRDLAPEEIAARLGGIVVFQKRSDGQWVAVISVEREEDASAHLTVPEGAPAETTNDIAKAIP
ncbi:MAG: glycosyltransferase [Acidobacteria bacterium]|nr:MAG: glycosyltransferase [Acidobacteriota bacterium]